VPFSYSFIGYPRIRFNNGVNPFFSYQSRRDLPSDPLFRKLSLHFYRYPAQHHQLTFSHKIISASASTLHRAIFISYFLFLTSLNFAPSGPSSRLKGTNYHPCLPKRSLGHPEKPGPLTWTSPPTCRSACRSGNKSSLAKKYHSCHRREYNLTAIFFHIYYTIISPSIY
jgi:hypothetical protein